MGSIVHMNSTRRPHSLISTVMILVNQILCPATINHATLGNLYCELLPPRTLRRPTADGRRGAAHLRPLSITRTGPLNESYELLLCVFSSLFYAKLKCILFVLVQEKYPARRLTIYEGGHKKK